MRRWHSPREQAIMLKRWKKEMEKHGYDWRNPPTDPSACHCAKGIGSMRKQTPLGCPDGRNCGICHPPKKPRNHRQAVEFELEAEAPKGASFVSRYEGVRALHVTGPRR